MNKLLTTVLMCILMSPLMAQVYTWKDSRGVVHFSDQPHPGATQLAIPEPQNFNSPQSAPQQPAESTQTTSSEDVNEADNKSNSESEYQSIAIVEPQEEETIRSNMGEAPVLARLEPKLRDGDFLQFLFDNKPIGQPQTGMRFFLSGLDRGSHTIAVRVQDAGGHVLGTSRPVIFFMQNPRVGMVPNTRPPVKAPSP